MPGKRKNTNTEEQVPVDDRDTQQEAFDKLSNKLTATFESGFEKLQQALLSMAAPAPAPQPAKTTVEDDISGPNTRNKALRAVYNPKETTKPPPKQPKGKSNRNATQTRRQADAMDVEQNDVMHLGTTSAGHLDSPNVNNPVSSENRDYAMNEWIINQAPKHKGSFSFNNLPTSTAGIPANSQLEAQVQNVLLNTASNLAKGNVPNGLYPHKYVLRGPEQKRMGLNSLTAIEYIGGILKMIKDPAVPANIKPYLYSHMEELVEDAADYDWQSAVRVWSEEIFTLIAEGRLPDGWAAHSKIQMLRMTISRASTAKLSTQNLHQNPTHPRIRQATAPSAHPNDNLRGGTPCINYNSPQGCLLQSGHYVSGKKLLHICAFCLWNSATPHPHAECYCRNKQRFNNQNHFQ